MLPSFKLLLILSLGSLRRCDLPSAEHCCRSTLYLVVSLHYRTLFSFSEATAFLLSFRSFSSQFFPFFLFPLLPLGAITGLFSYHGLFRRRHLLLRSILHKTAFGPPCHPSPQKEILPFFSPLTPVTPTSLVPLACQVDLFATRGTSFFAQPQPYSFLFQKDEVSSVIVNSASSPGLLGFLETCETIQTSLPPLILQVAARAPPPHSLLGNPPPFCVHSVNFSRFSVCPR